MLCSHCHWHSRVTCNLVCSMSQTFDDLEDLYNFEPLNNSKPPLPSGPPPQWVYSPSAPPSAPQPQPAIGFCYRKRLVRLGYNIRSPDGFKVTHIEKKCAHAPNAMQNSAHKYLCALCVTNVISVHERNACHA